MLMNFLRNPQEARETLAKSVSRFKNDKFLDAATAVCAVIAAADGVIGAEEKRKMMGFMKISEALKIFETHEVISKFEKHAGNFDFDYETGKLAALEIIGKFRGKPEAPTLVRLGIIIGGSDGNFDETERKAARQIAQALGLEPSEFDLA